jgi:hypothetical protein
MERLAGSRLLRLRKQRQIEQRNDFSETLAGLADPVHFRSRDAHSGTPPLNDCLGKCSHYAVDRRRTDHSFPANNGSLGGLALLGACEDRNDARLREIDEINFRRGAVKNVTMLNRYCPHVRF